MGKVKSKQGALKSETAPGLKSSLTNMWMEEVAAAESKGKHAAIAAAAAKEGGSGKDIRRRKLQMTIEAESDRKKRALHSVLATKPVAGSKAAVVAGPGAEVPKQSVFQDLLDALPSVSRPRGADASDPLSSVTTRIQPTSKSGKKVKARVDLGAVAQFAAIVNLPAFRSNAFATLRKQAVAADSARLEAKTAAV